MHDAHERPHADTAIDSDWGDITGVVQLDGSEGRIHIPRCSRKRSSWCVARYLDVSSPVRHETLLRNELGRSVYPHSWG
jgi:hypothetical protein